MGEPMRIQPTLHSWPSTLLEEGQESLWNAVCPGVQELGDRSPCSWDFFQGRRIIWKMDSWLHCHLRPWCSDFLFCALRSMFSRDQRPLVFGEGFVFTFGADSREARGSIPQVCMDRKNTIYVFKHPLEVLEHICCGEDDKPSHHLWLRPGPLCSEISGNRYQKPSYQGGKKQEFCHQGVDVTMVPRITLT